MGRETGSSTGHSEDPSDSTLTKLSKYKYFQLLKSYAKDSIRSFIFVITTDDAINTKKLISTQKFFHRGNEDFQFFLKIFITFPAVHMIKH